MDNNQGEILIYQSDDGLTHIDVTPVEEEYLESLRLLEQKADAAGGD